MLIRLTFATALSTFLTYLNQGQSLNLQPLYPFCCLFSVVATSKGKEALKVARHSAVYSAFFAVEGPAF